MEYQWDPVKATANVKKHGVEFADAVGVFDDPEAITVEDPDAEGEQRFLSIGLDILGRIIVVAYTYRGDRYPLDLRQESHEEGGGIL